MSMDWSWLLQKVRKQEIVNILTWDIFKSLIPTFGPLTTVS